MQNWIVAAVSIAAVGRSLAGNQGTSDEELIEGIREGGSVAMQILFARYQVRVYRFVLRRVGDAAIAEDLTSEVFITVWRHANQFEARSSVATWLLAIARYKSLAELRRRCRIESRLQRTPADDIASEPLESPVAAECGLQAEDQRRLVRKCLMRLPREHRTVIDLVYYHEKSVKEVADIVGISPNTVKTRMYYARRKLAELLKDEGIVAMSS
jgi:RNA polymerase sigma-70 factor (ECF subfamily)